MVRGMLTKHNNNLYHFSRLVLNFKGLSTRLVRDLLIMRMRGQTNVLQRTMNLTVGLRRKV